MKMTYISSYHPENSSSEEADNQESANKESDNDTSLNSRPEEVNPQTIISSTPAATPPSATPSKSPKRKKIILSAAVVAVLTVGIGIYAIINHNQSQPVEISKLSDAEKQHLGLKPTADDKAAEVEQKESYGYTAEYQAYRQLSDDEKSAQEVIPRKQEVPYSDLDHIQDDLDPVTQLPTKYTLTDQVDLPVGNQGSYGLCWDFASNTSLMTYELLRGDNYNPSEIQVDYLASNKMYGSRNPHDGGTFELFTQYASAIGTTPESATHYSDYPDYEYFDFSNNNDPHFVTKTVTFPAIRKENGTAIDHTDTEVSEFRSSVKQHIMQNGSLYAVINVYIADQLHYGSQKFAYCPSADVCQDSRGPHAVSIIGWDDNYSKENFTLNGHTPIHDGAYLILNSWGKSWGSISAPDGAFWVSYDEYNIETELSGVLSTSLDDAISVDSISSPAIRRYLRERYAFYLMSFSGREYISLAALQSITYLDLSSQSLTNADLSALATFPNLAYLNLSNNQLTSLATLPTLDRLVTLELRDNQLADISALCARDNFYALDLSNNQIADVSCFANSSKLQSLNLSDNPQISGYQQLTNLTELQVSDLNLHDLSSFAKLTNLYYLSVTNSGLTSTKGLEQLTNLEDLNLSHNHLTNISDFNSRDFYHLDLSYNSFSDLSNFQPSNINTLNLSGHNRLSNLSSLDHINFLALDDCEYNSFTQLSSLTHISSLSLEDNNFTSFDGIADLPQLQHLYLNNNHITNFDALPDLEILSLDNNGLTNLSALGSHQIGYLSLANNPISQGTLEGSFEWLDLSNCQLSSLDLSKIAPTLSSIVLTDNPDYKDFESLINTFATDDEYGFSITSNNSLTQEQIDHLSQLQSDRQWQLYGAATTISMSASNNQIDLTSQPELRRVVMRSLVNIYADPISNATTDRSATHLTIIDPSDHNITINNASVGGVSDHIFSSSVKINF